MAKLLDELEADWARIADDPAQVATITPLAEVAGVTTLRGLQDWTWRASRDDVDALLLELARRSRGGDSAAAGVLLRLLWPGVLALTARWQGLGDIDERASAVVTAVWARICTYPCERRPRAVAANVLLDAAKELRRHAQHRVIEPVGLDPLGVDVSAPVPMTGATEELLSLLVDAVAANTLTAFEARLVAETRIVGRPLTAVGPGRHVRSLQRQRRAAESRLVQLGAVA